MDENTSKTKTIYIQAMFADIASNYDRMNRIMTFGQDLKWRIEVVNHIKLPIHAHLLDLGAGTGDLAREALKQHPHLKVVAADNTQQMLKLGKKQKGSDAISWCAANALEIPFPDASFDAIVSGFLLRNVSNLLKCLKEQWRVLKPGGKLVALDTTKPINCTISLLIIFYLRHIIPCLGRFIARNRDAYRYLYESTQTFLSAENVASELVSVGFKDVGFRRYMGGIIAIHWGQR